MIGNARSVIWFKRTQHACVIIHDWSARDLGLLFVEKRRMRAKQAGRYEDVIESSPFARAAKIRSCNREASILPAAMSRLFS